MERFIVTETTRYEVEAENEDQAIEIVTNTDDPLAYYESHTVDCEEE